MKLEGVIKLAEIKNEFEIADLIHFINEFCKSYALIYGIFSEATVLKEL